MLRIAGKRIATSAFGLLAMTELIDNFSGWIGAVCIVNHCHCEERSDVAIRPLRHPADAAARQGAVNLTFGGTTHVPCI